MNYIDLALIIITALMVIIGACRGLIISLISMVRFTIGVPLSFFVSEMFSKLVYDGFVKEIAYQKVSERLADSQSVNSIIKSVDDFTNSLPSIFSKGIDTASFKILSIDEISRAITDSVVEPIAVVIIKILLFVITFVLFYIITGVIISFIKTLQKKDHMPLKRTDIVLGGVFGFVKAFVLMFTLATIIGYICSIIPQTSSFAKQADSSFALEFINTYNPLLK